MRKGKKIDCFIPYWINCTLSTSLVCFDFPIGLQASDQRQPHRRRDTGRNNRPPCLGDLLVRNHPRRVPNQMPDSIQSMKREWPSDDSLDRKGQRHRPRSKTRCQGIRAQIPAEVWRCGVCGAENVEGAAEEEPGDAISDGQDPGYLPAVDGEMRCRRASETLLQEAGIGSGGIGVRAERIPLSTE
jgi:hypothetical protein